MSFFQNLNRRRVLPWLGAYIAGGFLVLEGVDQLIGNDLLPAVSYRVALVFYLFGLLGTTILAWFHGEKGAQKPQRIEIWMQGTVIVAALATSFVVARNFQAAENAQIDMAAATGLDPRGIAVLYFADESPDADFGYVADGLTEALIDRLTQVRALDVVSRNGVAPYRAADIDADSIARALNVGSLIEGSVEPRGDELRVTTRLLDGLSGDVIERNVMELPAEDFLSARDSVAESITRFLQIRLGEEVRLRESRSETRSVDAWALVQRAERLRKDAEEAEESSDVDGALSRLAAADSLLAFAETIDSTWTRPSSLRAMVAFRRGYVQAAFLDDFPGGGAILLAGIPSAERALALSPSDAAALEARGTLRYTLWLLGAADDEAEAAALLDDAQADLEAAVDADPSLATAWARLSHLFMQRADNSSVILTARRAFEEDAFLRNADQVLNRLFWAHYDLEQFNDARERCDDGRTRFPTQAQFVECRLWLMIAPVETADPDLAWELQTELVATTPDEQRPLVDRLGRLLVGGVLRRASLTDSAAVVFESGRGDPTIDPQDELVAQEARIRAATGDTEGAMEMLRRYVAANPAHSFEVGGQLHWMWRSLRDLPEFRTLRSGN